MTAINQHNRRLTSTVEALLTPDTRALLDTLLRQESADEAAAGSNAAYKLTLMKEAVAVDQTGESERMGRRSAVGRSPLSIAQTCIGSSHARPRRLQYYAYGVIKAQIFQVTRRAERERYLLKDGAIDKTAPVDFLIPENQ